MTDERHTQGGSPTPRRAEPLQPDRPASGGKGQPDAPPTDPAQTVNDRTADRQAVQSKDAIDNNREGFG